jgi:energy-coupling factor transporter ATP-binding protein EcfA2
MAEPTASQREPVSVESGSRIKRFEIGGLFGRPLDHAIDFPAESVAKGEPSLLILSGPNGCGKTTVLRMIEGLLKLDFDLFRQLPFRRATLSLSTGEDLSVEWQDKKELPLFVEFAGMSARLARTKSGPYDPQQNSARETFRAKALPILSTIHYELLDIHRSLALRETDTEAYEEMFNVQLATASGTLLPRHLPQRRRGESSNVLARRVRDFVREAQVNYRKYFEAEQLELLPRILQRLSKTHELGKGALYKKIETIKARSPDLTRMGLQTDDSDVDALMDLLSRKDQFNDGASLAVFEAYVEMQQNRDQTRELIANRLVSFERIMAEFLVGKVVQIDAKVGLRITSPTGDLKETDLSSGEYHFLYMMVAALLCFRTGSIIAIDEPELSLHVTWQRKVVRALAKCAAGASPLFLFATHSSAISAEHRDQVKVLHVEE